jgi:hypothetical protein
MSGAANEEGCCGSLFLLRAGLNLAQSSHV